MLDVVNESSQCRVKPFPSYSVILSWYVLHTHTHTHKQMLVILFGIVWCSNPLFWGVIVDLKLANPFALNRGG